MKFSLSKCKNNDLEDVKNFLTENGYTQIGKRKIETKFNLEMFLFFESHEKDQVQWLSEILRFFEVGNDEYEIHNISTETLYQYNAIILLWMAPNLYIHPRGQGFRIVDKIIDEEFGLNFAEKTIENENIVLKNVNYIQKNKMKGITNYKKEQGEFPKASENYAFVSGDPNDKIFGNNIECGTGVTFPKNYRIQFKEDFYQLSKLINHVNKVLKQKQNKSILPRRRKIPRNSKLTDELDEKVLEEILNSGESAEIAVDISKIQISDNSIDIFSESNYLEAYVVNHMTDTKQEIEASSKGIVKFVKKNKKLIDDLNGIKLRVMNSDHNVISRSPLKDWMYCELEYKEQLYILDSGFWGYFNTQFSSLLEQQLSEINRVINYDERFNIVYSSGDGDLAGEGGYIKELVKNDNNLTKLHKKYVRYDNVPIEIADVYKEDSRELIAIKRGMDTSTCMYSFEQSTLSIQALINNKEFDVKNKLLESDGTEEVSGVTEDKVNEILDSRISSVLWLQSKKKYTSMIEDKQFDLNEIGSLLLKLKVVDWYSFVIENNFTPRIYMGLDLQNDND